MLAFLRVPGGALGLDERQRLAVVAPQHIVHIAEACVIGHAGDFHLVAHRRVEGPACFFEQHVDEGLASVGFGVVVGVRLGGVGLLRGGHGLAQGLQFGIQRSVVLLGCGQCGVTLLEPGFELEQLLGGLRRFGGRLGQLGEGEGLARRRAMRAAIGTGQPIAEVEQLAGGIDRICRGHLLGPMHRHIAQVFDKPGLGEQGLAHSGLEGGLVDEGAQVVLVRLA